MPVSLPPPASVRSRSSASRNPANLLAICRIFQNEAVSRAGDIWCAEAHRIRCGDSTDAIGIAALFAGVAPQLMVTDPPYGVDYDPSWRHKSGLNKSKRQGKVLNDTQADREVVWSHFPGDVAYVWHGALHATTVAESLCRQGFSIRSQIIWAKERLVIGRGNYHWMHEPCWYAVRTKGHWTGDRKQTTLWTIASGKQDAETAHGTQKPVECMRRPIQNNSSPGQAIFDPFLGSGTTLIAAETCGRVGLGNGIGRRHRREALAGVLRQGGDAIRRRSDLR
jgi:DNA modification methylase